MNVSPIARGEGALSPTARFCARSGDETNNIAAAIERPMRLLKLNCITCGEGEANNCDTDKAVHAVSDEGFRDNFSCKDCTVASGLAARVGAALGSSVEAIVRISLNNFSRDVVDVAGLTRRTAINSHDAVMISKEAVQVPGVSRPATSEPAR